MNAIGNAIDEFQEYSFQYNAVKIMSVSEVSPDETASKTRKLCVNLFKEIRENMSIQDIDTAHGDRPANNSAGNPKPIVCRLVRRLVREFQ